MDQILKEIADEVTRIIHPVTPDKTWATHVFVAPKVTIENCYNVVFRTSIGKESALFGKGKGNRPIQRGYGKKYDTHTTYNGQPVWFRLIQQVEVAGPKAVKEQDELFEKIANTIIQSFQQHESFRRVTG